jgi:hypothetical protein
MNSIELNRNKDVAVHVQMFFIVQFTCFGPYMPSSGVVMEYITGDGLYKLQC